MSTPTTSRHRPGRLRSALALALGLALLTGPLGSSAGADAGHERRSTAPALTLGGTGTWQIREWINDVVVNGTGELSERNGRTREVLVAAPGERFVYSDINFFLLGEIVRRVSGETLDVYARKVIFEPLGMRDTGFLPPAALIPRIAPTERNPAKTGAPLRGVVHDPTARFMGGVAGHAGLFSTAADLSRFAQMMLNDGELDGVRMFNPLTVAKFTTPQSPPDQPILRGLGWDIDSPHSANRGELFPIGSFEMAARCTIAVTPDSRSRGGLRMSTKRCSSRSVSGRWDASVRLCAK